MSADCDATIVGVYPSKERAEEVEVYWKKRRPCSFDIEDFELDEVPDYLPGWG